MYYANGPASYGGMYPDTTQPPGSYVSPAPSTTVLEPSVGYERLAPGGRGYLPTEWLPSHPTMPPQQQLYMQQPPPPPFYGQQPQFTGGVMSATMPAQQPYGYAAAQPHAAMTMPPSYGQQQQQQQSQQPLQQQQQQQHMHSVGPPVHAASEKTGKVPYHLPRPLAAPLGFPAVTAPYPTLAEASAEGDVITISATGAARWRLELKDAQWERPIDAVADTKTATFRLSGACDRKMKVRLCTVTAAGETGVWTAWEDVKKKEPKKEEPKKEEPKKEEPAASVPPTSAPAPPAMPATAPALPAASAEPCCSDGCRGSPPTNDAAASSSSGAAGPSQAPPQ